MQSSYTSWHSCLLGHTFSSTSQRISSKESSRVCYPASAGICCDVITRCIHGSQRGHLCMWRAYTFQLHAEKNSSVGLRNGEQGERYSISILLWVANHYLLMFEWWKLTLSQTITYFGKSSSIGPLSCSGMRSLQRVSTKVTRRSVLFGPIMGICVSTPFSEIAAPMVMFPPPLAWHISCSSVADDISTTPSAFR